MVVAFLIFKFKNKKQAECLFCCDVGNIRYCSITIITALILIRLMCWQFASACELNNEHTELKSNMSGNVSNIFNVMSGGAMILAKQKQNIFTIMFQKNMYL